MMEQELKQWLTHEKLSIPLYDSIENKNVPCKGLPNVIPGSSWKSVRHWEGNRLLKAELVAEGELSF